MNYIGSKQSLIPFIDRVLREVCDGDEKVLCDIFAGTGAVGRHFKSRGYRIIANDFQYYAYALNKAYLEINHTPRFATLRRVYHDQLAVLELPDSHPLTEALAIVNNLDGVSGFLSRNYGPEGKRLYYTAENAAKADAIRQTLEDWQTRRIINRQEFFYLLCSLIEAIDAVANTASVYGAFLKRFKASALRPMQLRPLSLSNDVKGCRVFCEDANQLIERIECDVLYLDPPYNHRQYGANYHVLETIAAYDQPTLSGVTGMREYRRSRYCVQGAAAEALEHLVMSARAKHILLSYNDEGLLNLDEVRRILGLRGKTRTFELPGYSRFKADNGRTYKRETTVEYVHYVRTT